MRSTLQTRPLSPRGSAAHRAVIARVENYVHSNRCVRVPVSALCRVAGLSERALRNAFYDVHGVGPKRWMLDARLRDVRRALTNAPASATTVTVVAADHGFYELGRFAVAYRETFGESPSTTLRGTRRRPLTWLDILHKRI
jgi:AraC-like DNA-binding protein